MREIKFRAWDTENNRFTPNIILAHEGMMYWQFGYDALEHVEKDRYVIQMATGLHDKNGKEIYEGDILYCLIKQSKTDHKDDDGVRVVVEFGDGMFRDKTTWNDLSDYLTEWPSLEVIGDIYSNPGLLA